MQEFTNLRNTYETFIYKDFEIKKENDYLLIKYYFQIPNLGIFEPTIKILNKNLNIKEIDNNVKNIVFNLGIVEAISYWKCVCPKNMIIECGKLDEKQTQWFKKLFFLGLGEFRYINNIKVDQEEFIKIYSEGNKIESEKNKNTLEGTLIPIGGGKDSTVTLKLLEKEKEKNSCIMIGGKDPSITSAKTAGYTDEQIIHIERTIDKNLLDLNKKGFLNGHTPFSAMLAFLSYLVAYLTNKKYIALSNESSANETNVKGENINHQYSKTIEFENDFRNYAENYLKAGIEYFSLLRPLNELQIAKLFSENEEYHKVFKSCNVGSKTVPWKWCAKCPKCLFVFIILSPFLYKEKLVEIFGKDLYEDEELLNTFIELLGLRRSKTI